MYKLIALDMDGTTLRKDHSISEKTKYAIKKAKEKGVKVVLATGRPIKGIERYLDELDLVSSEDYAITCNGAVVQNTSTGQVISKDTFLTKEEMLEVYEESVKLGVNFHAFSVNRGCVTPKNSKYTEHEVKINGIDLTEMSLYELDNDDKIIKVMMVDEPEVLDNAIEKLQKKFYDKYTVVKSAPFFLEFLNKKVNKGEGVRTLATTLGIRKEEIICMGDAENDLHMIQYAGLGVAMENAFDHVKKEADYITKSNEDDGVAHVIEKFVL